MIHPFNVAQSAGNAAAFAGILAAIVLAVLGQLAVTARRVVNTASSITEDRHHKFQLSLLLGLPLLVALLADTYMFVLLSGGTAEPSDSAAIRTSAFQFSICGSVLAASAAAAIVFLHLVLLETGSKDSVVAAASRTVILVGVLIDAIFLVYGYGDIHAAFYGSYFGPGLWTLHALVLMVSVAVGLWTPWPQPLCLQRNEHSVWSRDHPRLLATAMALVTGLSTLLPSVGFLAAGKHTFKVGESVMWMTYGSAAWAGVVFGGLIWLMRTTTD